VSESWSSTDDDTDRGGLESVDPDAFRDVIGRFASGVTVITASCAGVDYGMTASAVTSLSLQPPMLLVCINRANATYRAVSRSRVFAVNILGEGQAELAGRFASSDADKFVDVEVLAGRLGAPLLADALATVECRVTEHFAGGTHEVFFGRVVVACAREGAPLTYFRGSFGRFGTARDEAIYEDLREQADAHALLRGGSAGTPRLRHGSLVDEDTCSGATATRCAPRSAKKCRC